MIFGLAYRPPLPNPFLDQHSDLVMEFVDPGFYLLPPRSVKVEDSPLDAFHDTGRVYFIKGGRIVAVARKK